MSLLMKALEKAAKDREGTDAERASAAPAGAPSVNGGLQLEPMATPSGAARDPAPAASQSARPNSSPVATPRQPEQAATVISAGRSGGGGVSAFVRDRPLAVFGAIAGIVGVAYGAFVYLQLTNPGLFASKPPAPPPSAQIARPPTATPAPPPPTSTQAAEPLSPLTLADAETAPGAATATTATGAKAPASTAKASANANAASAPAIAVAATNLAATPPATVAPALPIVAPPAPTLVAAPAAPRDAIRVTTSTTTPVINPLLTEAYAALNAGNFDASQRLYEQLLRSDTGNVDALLGLAAIATQQGSSDEAMRRYLKVLELDPRNAPAQAGLIGILGGADPMAAETRVKVLISREPVTAFLHFALGITYIDQKRWPDAQQAFFQAYSLQSDNPDYAYNLAVALEHIGQPKSALTYYRQALQLATAKGRANFSTIAAEERIGKLEKAVR